MPVKTSRRAFLQTVAATAAYGLGSARQTPGREVAEETPVLDDSAQLFVDLDRVDTLVNLRQDYHQAQKHPANPVIRKTKPWENDRGTWGSVIYDADLKLFKAWYGGKSGTKKEFRPGSLAECSVLCYAVSEDGVNWQRPNLGLHEIMGTRENNVVIGDDHHNGLDHWESTLKDPLETDPQRRYKALGWSSYDWDGPMSGIYSMTSPDGLDWTHTPEPLFRYHPRPGTDDLGPVGDAQSLMIDTLRRRYVAFLRRLPHRAASVSDDFVSWTPPEVRIRARDGEVVNTIYNHMGFVYGDRYLGLLTYFVRDPANPLVTVRLLTSRNGLDWQRPETDHPLIDVGEFGQWDRFNNLLTGAPPIRVDDRLYIYYRGLANRHGISGGTVTAPDDAFQQHGGIGLATLRVDGFASLAASYDGGVITTKAFRFRGGRLRVNVKSDFGRLQAEVLGEHGEVLDGYARDDCREIIADSIDEPVRWRERTALEPAMSRPVRIRFFLNNARLYSFRMV